ETQGLGPLGGPDAERGGLVGRPHRARMLEHVEVDPRLLEETGHVCHRSSFPANYRCSRSRVPRALRLANGYELATASAGHQRAAARGGRNNFLRLAAL